MRSTALSAVSILEPMAVAVDVTPLPVAATFRRLANRRGHHCERCAKNNCLNHDFLCDVCIRLEIEANVAILILLTEWPLNEADDRDGMLMP
jgi:hypothetical protein